MSKKPGTDSVVEHAKFTEMMVTKEERALLTVMRQARQGTIEVLDFKDGVPYCAKGGVQRFEFSDPDFIDRTLSGESVVMIDLSDKG